MGRRFVDASPADRQVIRRERLLTLRLFRELADILARAADHRIDRDYVLEYIVLRMPEENYERVFDTLVGWGRFGNLFAYDEDGQVLFAQ